MDEPFSYDRVAYPSFVFPKIRPSRIGAVAAMHGLAPPDIARSRVLELGCGDGVNLISIAYAMPDADCVGVDLSVERIREANVMADRIGISNTSFRQLNVMDLSPGELGEFDFIIAHGLFSWVPDVVREQILYIYAACLKPTGIGFISYNAFPGWHMRNVIRDAMRFQSEAIREPIEKVETSVAFVDFLCDAVRPDDDVYGSFLQREKNSIARQPRPSIYHDDLADVNQPFYFKDFVALISKHGLKFVSEAEPIAFFDKSLPLNARNVLDQLWEDPIRREQLFDFIRCTRFRSTLVCHGSAHPCYRPVFEPDQHLYLSSISDPVSEHPVFTDTSVITFSGEGDARFSTNHPLSKTALSILSSVRPKQLTFDELADEVRKSFPQVDEAAFRSELEILKKFVLEYIEASVIEIAYFVPDSATEISERPRISELARCQSEIGYSYMTGMTGKNVMIANDLVRALVRLLDGSRDRDQLVNDLREGVSVPSDQLEAFHAALPDLIDTTLRNFLNADLLLS